MRVDFRLLKEKQDHEDRNNSSSVHSALPTSSHGIKSPPPTGESSTSTLPLLQRVLLLKSKEDHALLSSSQPTSPTTITPTTTTARNSISLPGSSSKSIALSSIANKISFRDRLKLHKDVNKELTIRESRESKDIKDTSEITEPSSQFSSISSVSDSEKCEAPWSKLKKAAIVRDTCETSSIPSCSSSSTKSRVKCDKDTTSKVKLSLVTLHRETKNYCSIDDLSPEYGGLPFVKKLKILNERQKLAELESEIKKRSFSLDIPDTQQKDDTLTRSQSEGSKMHQDRQQNENNLLVAPLTSSSSIHSTNESNETLERRNLKSILKKLSEEVQVCKIVLVIYYNLYCYLLGV